MGSVGSHKLKNTVFDSIRLYITIFNTKQEGLWPGPVDASFMILWNLLLKVII